MKYIFSILFFFAIFHVNASGDNLYQKVLITNAKLAHEASKSLIIALNKNNKIPKKEFKNLVIRWKKVEAIYILSSLDDKYIDTPWYLDMFHGKNENIKVQLNRIIESEENIVKALYKNSHKTINALEYVLYTHDLDNPRVKDIALLISRAMENRFLEILNGYIINENEFLKDNKIGSALLLNSLVESSYKLKEWRVGDVAGITRKYKGKPDNTRSEYYLSGNSVEAIKAILEAHKQIINSNQYEDFSDFAKNYNANKEIALTIKWLNNSFQILSKIKNDNLTGDLAKEFYQSSTNLQNGYYSSLMNKLNFVAKILDADGD